VRGSYPEVAVELFGDVARQYATCKVGYVDTQRRRKSSGSTLWLDTRLAGRLNRPLRIYRRSGARRPVTASLGLSRAADLCRPLGNYLDQCQVDMLHRHSQLMSLLHFPESGHRGEVVPVVARQASQALDC